MTTIDEQPLTLNLDPKLGGRLRQAASRKGLPTERYCQQAIERELARDEEERKQESRTPRLSIEELIALRKERFGDRVFPGDSADLIREAREIRNAQMDEWSQTKL